MSQPDYPKFALHIDLTISDLYTIYYFEHPVNFKLVQSENNFWTLFYVDKGELVSSFDGQERQLKQGDLMLYKPNTRHSGHTLAHNAPNIINITFECASPCMETVENRPIQLVSKEKHLLSNIMQEAYQAFEMMTQSRQIVRKADAPFASEQLIRNYLEILLLQIIRRTAVAEPMVKDFDSSLHENKLNRLLDDVVAYMKDRLSAPLSMEQLCRHFGIGKAHLTQCFKARFGYGVMQYFRILKTEEAKKLIREDHLTITEISDFLGYNNVQYFCKQFKLMTGMKPTEYARTVKIQFGRGHSRLTAINSGAFTSR